MRNALLASLFATLAACGGADKPATAETTPTEPDVAADPMVEPPGDAHEHPGEHHGHGNHTPEMVAFHDVLRPLWHADPGQARTDDTCKQAGHLLDLANGIQNAAPPTGVDRAQWDPAVRRLMVGIAALMDQGCKGGDFEGTFREVHDAFHGLMDVLPQA